jgi:hypothetical protein
MLNLEEPVEFLYEIHKAGVKYLLIGRRAIIAYGGPVQTMDYDIYVEPNIENINLLLDIAKKFELYPSLPKDQIMKNFKFRLENNFALDVFKAKKVGREFTFDELYERRTILKGEKGFEINVPSIDDLIALKKLRSLPRDLEDIKYLRALKKKR